VHMDQQLMLISGSKTFFVYVFQPPFTSIFCLHFFDLKGLDRNYGKDMKRRVMMFTFFKCRRNPEDNYLVILLKPKPIPFFVVSSNGSNVESNFEFNRNNLLCNLFVLMDCPFILLLW